MKNNYNKLRIHRKQTQITQADIAYLLNHSDNSSISRVESGDRQPSIEILLAYHLLFDMEIGDFFLDQRDVVRRRIASRIKHLVRQIENECEQQNPKIQQRTSNLLKALGKLNWTNAS